MFLLIFSMEWDGTRGTGWAGDVNLEMIPNACVAASYVALFFASFECLDRRRWYDDCQIYMQTQD